MTAVLSVILVILLFFLLPKRAEALIRIRKEGIFAKGRIKLIFGLIPVKFHIKAVYYPPLGFVLFFLNKSVLLGSKKPKKGIELFKHIEFKKIIVTGLVGANGHPVLTAQLAGAIDIVIIQAVLAAFGIKPYVNISPDFNENSFAVNIDCIANVELGKLIIKGIASERRKNNESSDRKHNAVVNGAYQKAR